MRDLDNHFGSYNHLAHLPRADEALHILRKAASCVKPLMRKRGWRVGMLSEFIPEQPNLLGLNINRGEQIQIRLRYPGDLTQFLPFEQVLDTLLHELSHNVWGPHDANFNRLWNELRDEWETLQMKGFSGEGFLGKGQALGGHRVPVEEVRRRARVAAQKRAEQFKNRTDPGRRLGGASGQAQMPPSRRRLRDVLASAAQSRSTASTTTIDSGCANGSDAGTKAGKKAANDALRNGFKTRAEMDDANSIAIAQALQELYEQEEDNRIYDGLSGLPPPGGLVWDPENGLQAIESPPRSSSSTPVGRATPSVPQPPRSASIASRPGPATSSNSSGQEYNARGMPLSRLVREAESTQRHRGRSAYPAAPISALQNWPESEMGANFSGSSRSSARRPSTSEDAAWACPQCTFQNNSLMERCEMCDAPKTAFATKPSSSRRPVADRSHGYPTSAGQNGPIGWNCRQCGSFMENHWWACSACGMIKASS